MAKGNGGQAIHGEKCPGQWRSFYRISSIDGHIRTMERSDQQWRSLPQMPFYILGEKSKRDSIVEMENVETLLTDPSKKVGQERLIFMVWPIRTESRWMNPVVMIRDDSMQRHSVVAVPINQRGGPGEEMNVMTTANQFKRELKCNASAPTQTRMAYHGDSHQFFNLPRERACSPGV
jgi:hypothetical protein